MMNKIPKGWEVKKLGEICEKISAGGDKPAEFSPIKTNDFKIPIYSNGIKDNGLYGYTKYATINKQAVTVSARGTIGFVCVRNEPFCPIVRLISAIPKDNILDLKFLAYALKFKIPSGEGSSIPQLTVPNFKQLEIPLPPLSEQKAIADKLDDSFVKIENAITNLINAKENLKLYKQSVLKSAFNGDLIPNTSPTHWEVKKLGDFSEIKGGKRLPANSKFSKDTTKFAYIRVADFENMSVNLKDIKYITQEVQDKIKNYTISSDDIYISIAGTIGKVGTIPIELNGANLTENAAKITFNGANKKFLVYYLNSNEAQMQIIFFTKATTQAKLALYRIKEIKIPLPPLSEQNLIVAEIDRRFAIVDKTLNLIDKSIQNAKNLKQSILKKAFSGELRSEI
ncbi:Type I restriction-modification system, specificity subunit S [Campylobacter devanensis]|uniref:Type I restriction/modification system, S subunit n=2 Tax=Campylobacter devanensis TaxID=3161138 RepID=A0A1X9SQN0_9BACT|nr:type I restriction/modification system, S subunit [Campylobacter lanienae]SUX01613.1 Type I restriction-modification system, specificity subunit S [Campylobacter lanienae]